MRIRIMFNNQRWGLKNLVVKFGGTDDEQLKMILEAILRSHVIATFSDYKVSKLDEVVNQNAHRSSIRFEKC